MTAVYYSLAGDPHGVHARQWVQSVRSLRRHNAEIEIVLCLYGAASPQMLDVARSERVHVEPMGDYLDAFGDVPAHWRAALGTYPVLHKLMSLRHLVRSHGERLLYLDCDTYCVGDIAKLLDAHDRCEWYAREEPYTRRSASGYEEWHVDEDALAGLAAAEGLVSIPPYNTGVFLVGRELARAIAELVDDFLWYAWRLLLGASLWRPDVIYDPWLAGFVREHSLPSEHRVALPYPCGSGWILEEIATWLTLGRVPGLTHDMLDNTYVAQDGEYAASGGYVLAHYFTAGEADFFARIGQLRAAA